MERAREGALGGWYHRRDLTPVPSPIAPPVQALT